MVASPHNIILHVCSWFGSSVTVLNVVIVVVQSQMDPNSIPVYLIEVRISDCCCCADRYGHYTVCLHHLTSKPGSAIRKHCDSGCW